MSALTNSIALLTPSTTAEPMAHTAAREEVSAVAALTARMAACDEDAFRQFHEQYFHRLLRYHLILARGDEHAAREALQETFLRVVRHARRFENEEVFWSWLTVLARSAAVDGGRKRNRYWQLLAGYARALLPRDEPSPTSDSDGRLEEILDESLMKLEPESRALVEGKYLRRASVRELALETGLTEKAVESRLLRARRELRELILKKLRHENIT